jgi:NitT/TauT family transport system substrate-binding protein
LGGADVVYLAATMDSMSYQIVARPEIRSVQNLKGKRIGISRFGASPDVAVRMALRKLGLNPESDVSIIQTGGSPERLAALLGKKIDATVLNAPFDKVAQKHNLTIIADTSKLGVAYFDTGIVTTRGFVKSHEEIVRQFMKSYVEAVSVFKTKRVHTLAVASRYARVSDTKALEDAYEYFVDKIPRYPYPTLTGMQTVLNELARSNPKAKGVKPEDLIDAEFVKELENMRFVDPYYK